MFFFFLGLFSSLLRLLATHFPHLSLVEDWLDDEIITIEDGKESAPNNSALADSIKEGKFQCIDVYFLAKCSHLISYANFFFFSFSVQCNRHSSLKNRKVIEEIANHAAYRCVAKC